MRRLIALLATAAAGFVLGAPWTRGAVNERAPRPGLLPVHVEFVIVGHDPVVRAVGGRYGRAPLRPISAPWNGGSASGAATA